VIFRILLSPRRREFPQADIQGKSINPSPVPHSLGEAVSDALGLMTAEDQEVLRAYFYERLSYSEIARGSGLAGKTSAAWRVNAALGRLKVLLAKDGITYGE
jgi:DNA-directed RNA polymerase specialized sigma24 family protein